MSVMWILVDIVVRYLVGNSRYYHYHVVDRYRQQRWRRAGGRCVRVPAVKSTPNNIVLTDSRIVNTFLLSVYLPLNLLTGEWRRRKPTYVTAEANMTSGMTSGLLTSTSAARCFQNTK
jgi:hypothetical protein